MALSYPYALDFLANCLTGPEVPLKLQRFDEMSGSGDGRFWSAQLAPPLWSASYALYAKDAARAREMNAKVNALDGMAKTFLWCDPYYSGPASGVITGLAGVTISAVRADRGAIALTGLPAGFTLTAGDFFSVNFASGRVYFGQFSEGGVANASGAITQKEMRPYLPQSIAVGAAVQLVRPHFKAIVTEYQPFSDYLGEWGQNASITILQKT